MLLFEPQKAMVRSPKSIMSVNGSWLGEVLDFFLNGSVHRKIAGKNEDSAIPKMEGLNPSR